jgi:hypothetical protein
MSLHPYEKGAAAFSPVRLGTVEQYIEHILRPDCPSPALEKDGITACSAVFLRLGLGQSDSQAIAQCIAQQFLTQISRGLSLRIHQ